MQVLLVRQQNLEADLKEKEESIEALQATLQSAMGEINTNPSRVKYNKPQEYKGERETLQAFLTQMNLHLRVNKIPLASDQVCLAATFLKDKAFDWFNPTMRDWMDNDEEDQRPETRRMFSSYANFEKEIRNTFGDIDEKGTAERQLGVLRQRGSASKYTSEFQQVASLLPSYGEDALKNTYYVGLKEDIKDEISRGDKPDTLRGMIELAVRIDNRQYERRAERQYRKLPTTWHGHVRRQEKPEKRRNYDPDEMQIDATYKQEVRKWKPKTHNHEKPKQREWKPKGVCFNCGKKGHYADKCMQNKPERTIAATTAVSHGAMSWTACYDDNCMTHNSDKRATGYYPRKKKTTREIAVTNSEDGEFLLEGYDAEIYYDTSPSPDNEESDPDEWQNAAYESRQETIAITQLISQTETLMENILGASGDESSEEEWHETVERPRTSPEDGKPPKPELQANTDLAPVIRPKDPATLDSPDTLELDQAEDPWTTDEGVEEDTYREQLLPHGTETSYTFYASRTPKGETRRHRMEDTRISANHCLHGQIAWVSCLDDECTEHKRMKERHNCWPHRVRYYVITRPILREEAEHYVPGIWDDDHGTVTLIPDPWYPMDCRQGKDWRICYQDSCLVHAEKKHANYWPRKPKNELALTERDSQSSQTHGPKGQSHQVLESQAQGSESTKSWREMPADGTTQRGRKRRRSLTPYPHLNKITDA
jgi:hypothetical protein